MRLLSALFFIGRKTTANKKEGRLLWRAACPQDSSRGIGDAHQQAEFFLYKRTLLASI